jgi:hypothetical protein
MFLWRGAQVVFLLVMISVCAMALVYPSWRRWYDAIFAPLFIAMAILALAYILRK